MLTVCQNMGLHTPSAVLLWIAAGGPADIHLIHLTGLVVLIGGAAIAFMGILIPVNEPDPGEPTR